MKKIYLVFFLFPSSSQLAFGILHLLLRPASVGFDLLLVGFSSRVISLACSIHWPCIAVGPGETRATVTTGRHLAPPVRSDGNKRAHPLPGGSHQASGNILVVHVHRDHLSCLTVDHLTDGPELGAAVATAKREHTWMRANMSSTLCCQPGSPH